MIAADELGNSDRDRNVIEKMSELLGLYSFRKLDRIEQVIDLRVGFGRFVGLVGVLHGTLECSLKVLPHTLPQRFESR